MQQNYLMKQTAEYRAKIDALERQRDQKEAEHATIQATIDKLSTVIPIVQQRVDIRKASSDREYTSKFQYLEMVQLLVEQQQELIVQKSRSARGGSERGCTGGSPKAGCGGVRSYVVRSARRGRAQS